jgi:rfaE bifunctional protein nucleotidyltransferase chain/domain
MPDRLGLDAERLRQAGIDPAPVEVAATAVAAALRARGKLLTLGNGASGLDAQHVAAELVGRFEAERAGWPAVALSADSAVLTAIGNDFGFENVFARQVQALGRPGDVLLAISTSGRSANVLAAVAAGRTARITTIGLCGRADSSLARNVDVAICAPGTRSAPVQEGHRLVEHCLCRAVETILLGDPHAKLLAPPGSVVDLARLVEMRACWRATGRVVVWTNGCFDLLHSGHLRSLEAARALGDLLVVGVNGDESARRCKGEGRPLIPVVERAELLAALRPVDYVVVFDEDTPEGALAALQPDIHTKGGDYAGPGARAIPERVIVESYGGRVEILPLVPGHSTSALVGAICGGPSEAAASNEAG